VRTLLGGVEDRSTMRPATLPILAGLGLTATLVNACGVLLGIGDLPRARDAGADAELLGGTGVSAETSTGATTGADSATCAGRDCLGGACNAGVCEPVVLAPTDGPQGLAVDADKVYWTNSNTGQVAACAKSGCNDSPEILVSQPSVLFPQRIAVQGNAVYYLVYDFSRPGSVLKCGTSGCNGCPVTIASKQIGPAALAIDSKNLYWTNVATGQVMQCSLGGCNDSPIVLAFGRPGLRVEAALCVDTSSVYWSDTTGIVRCAIDGCNHQPTVLVPGAQAYSLAVDGKNLYWTDYANGFVYECPKTGCAQPVALAQAQYMPVGLAIDASNVYWANAGGTIMKCGLDGCPDGPVTIASGQGSPGNVAVDDSRVYWTDYTSNGTVMALAK
jgi:hypothetical protein